MFPDYLMFFLNI